MGAMAGGSLLSQIVGCKPPAMSRPKEAPVQAGGSADYTLTIAVKPVELAPNRIVSTTTYNGQFPGPLLRFKEGQPVTIDIIDLCIKNATVSSKRGKFGLEDTAL